MKLNIFIKQLLCRHSIVYRITQTMESKCGVYMNMISSIKIVTFCDKCDKIIKIEHK